MLIDKTQSLDKGVMFRIRMRSENFNKYSYVVAIRLNDIMLYQTHHAMNGILTYHVSRVRH
jgi:hypothetical protein